MPRPGAAGYQLSNPSALDMSAVVASLEMFNQATIKALHHKSRSMTAYLQLLLLKSAKAKNIIPFALITPIEDKEKGAQISIRLEPGLLDVVLHHLEENGVVVDERKPDVVRVAPAPLYNNCVDVWKFVQIFLDACQQAAETRGTLINGSEKGVGQHLNSGIADNGEASESGERGTMAYGPNAK